MPIPDSQVFELTKALPNKLLNSDGSITDFQGNIITPASEIYAEVFRKTRAIANKFIIKTGEQKTYAEISFEMFIVVDTLPETGKANKIYLVPSEDENNKFDEYFWNENDAWDKIGEVNIDLSGYPTKTEVANDIATNSTEDKAYTDEQIRLKITDTLGGVY